ncbi:MAG: hypothetical protein R3Y33_04660 [Clostridia bacterium]
MKKIFLAIVSVAISLVCLTACSASANFEGTWESSAVQEIDLGMDGYDYSITFEIVLTLDSSNAYSLNIKAGSDYLTDFEEILVSYVNDNIQAIMESEGITEEETIALIEESSEMSMEEYLAETLESFSASIPEEGTTTTGSYETSGNTLTLIDETSGESVFTMEDGILTTTEDSFGDLEFTKTN